MAAQRGGARVVVRLLASCGETFPAPAPRSGEGRWRPGRFAARRSRSKLGGEGGGLGQGLRGEHRSCAVRGFALVPAGESAPLPTAGAPNPDGSGILRAELLGRPARRKTKQRLFLTAVVAFPGRFFLQ